MNLKNETPSWVEGTNIIETAYVKYFLSIHPLMCINENFYDVDGAYSKAAIRKSVTMDISKYMKSDVANKVTKIINLMTDITSKEDIIVEKEWLFFKNGDFNISERKLYPKERICLYRLPVSYNPDAHEPIITKSFLNTLLEPMDVKTLQEFIGYMFLTSNPAQKMLMILGRGGEGKSQVGEMVKALFGDYCINGSIADLSSNKYIGPMLEFKNVFLDDDMKLSALKDTDLLKKIITNNGKLMLEKKFKDIFQGYVYVKLMAFGNGLLKSLYDRSMGFYRRQIVLTAKKIPEGRETDPFLGEKIKSEAEGILLWALEGLYRLSENNFQFTISDSAKRNIQKIMDEQDTVGAFLKSKGYIQFGPENKSSTRALYKAYCEFCDNNNVNKVAQQSFNSYLSENGEEYGLKYSKHIKGLYGVESRGYLGVCTRLDYNQDMTWSNTPQDKYYE